MSDVVGELSVKVTADTSGLTRKIASDSESSGKKLTKSFAAVGAVAAGVGLAAAAIGTKFASGAITAAQEAAVANARFDQVAKSMGFVGGAYEGATARAKDYASELSRQIGVEDESILAVQTKLATFRNLGKTMDVAGGQFDRATKAAYDLASAGFGSAESNAVQLGKALQDPIKGITALGRAGVTFTDAEKDKIKALVEGGEAAKAQEIVLKALETQVGGVAEASVTASDKFKIAFGEMQEKVGGALLPVMNEIVDKIIPIIDELAGPLSEIASVVGGTLAEAFQTVSPLIKPLVEALSQLASSVAGGFITTLSAIIPAITPVLVIIGDLAERVGPLLEKILGKVADVLVRVLDAVVPLLEPLLDLVFVILDAAWPIVELVADVFLLLVDAVKPLLGVIIGLAGPLGQLVTVLLAAIMPIIKPLLPVIEALAVVLADVLGRAIGLLITGIGYLLIAFSKVAPFVLNNLTKPVTMLFLTFAENIVGAAASAFGWIPGLGDKLDTAKDAISTFKTNAVKGIEDAATKISVEGKKIGEGLVEQGLAAMKDPTAAGKYATAGKALGTVGADALERGIASGQIPAQAAGKAVGAAAVTGMRTGINAQLAPTVNAAVKVGTDTGAGLAQGLNKGNPAVTTAARNLANNVTTTAQTTLGVRSPSRVFMGIGGFVVQGLQQGITDAWGTLQTFWSGKITGIIDGAKSILGIASPSKVFIAMGGNVSEGFGIGLEAIGDVNQKFLEKLQSAVDVSETKIDGWVTTTKSQLDDAVSAWQDYRDEVFTSITGNVNFADAMTQTEDQQKAIEDARKALAAAQVTATAPEASQADKDALGVAQQQLAEAQAAVKTFEGNLGAMLDQSDFFGTAFAKASDAMIAQFGADSPIWQAMRAQMLAAGPGEGVALAQYIADNGLSPAMKERLLGWNAWAGEVATDQADKNTGQGVEMAKNAMKGLKQKIKDERDSLVKMGENMGDGVVVGFKNKESAFKSAIDSYIKTANDTLGIKSPSRVFAAIGAYTAEGFNRGYTQNIMDPVDFATADAPTVRMYSPAVSADLTGGMASMTDVKVYIGEKELTDIVDVQIHTNDARSTDLVIAGRRY